MVEIKEVAVSANPENEAMLRDGTDNHQPNGEVQGEQNQAPVENPHQPTRLESFFAITKSLILRALIFYFITSFFRRPATAPAEQGAGSAPAKLPAFNYFENGSIMVNEDEF